MFDNYGAHLGIDNEDKDTALLSSLCVRPLPSPALPAPPSPAFRRFKETGGNETAGVFGMLLP